MSGGFPSNMSACNSQTVVNAAASMGIAVSAPTNNDNVKGAWTQLVAATASDTSLVELVLCVETSNWGGSQLTFSLDIGMGSAGSEIVVIADIVLAPPYLNGRFVDLLLPLEIPAGSRLAARVQQNNATDQTTPPVYVTLNTFDGGFACPAPIAGFDTIGFDAASTRGAAITPSATAATKGAYLPLIAATTRDYVGLFVCVDSQIDSFSWPYLLDIAIGASGSEVDLLSNVQLYQGVGNTNVGGLLHSPFLPVEIPAGTRVSARCQTEASGKPIGLTLYGAF